jgi:hypothetical protein
MQRRIAAFVLAAVSLLAGLRLAVAAQDSEAMRCAIACGHAASPDKGAACCPMAGAGPSFKACAQGNAALAPLAAPQPAVLAAGAPLAAPAFSLTRDLDGESRPRFAPPRPLDHVPLLFG